MRIEIDITLLTSNLDIINKHNWFLRYS